MLLTVDRLSVFYGPVQALREISFTVAKGEIVSLIGANGAGKSTTLRALSGVVQPSAGSIAHGGMPIAGLPSHRIARLGIAHVPEGRGVFANMSVRENLEMGAYTRSSRKEVKESFERVFRLFPRLAERRTQEAGTLSGGERQMLAMGRALMAKPSLLMPDEPSLGLAPLIVREVFRIVQQLRDMGVAVLLVEQNARAALQVADYGYVLENGSVAVENDAKSLLNDPRVIESYLGLGGSHSIAA